MVVNLEHLGFQRLLYPSMTATQDGSNRFFRKTARVEPLLRLLQEKAGIRSQHCAVIATDIKQKVDEEIAEAGGPSTSRKSPRVTLCVEGNISAGKSTFLNWVAQGHPELQGMLEVRLSLAPFFLYSPAQ